MKPNEEFSKNLYEMMKRIQQTEIKPIAFSLNDPGKRLFELLEEMQAHTWKVDSTTHDVTIEHHVNCRCDMPPLSIEDQLQRELAFDEALLILKKIAGFDVRSN